jgi:hypothetical protein
MLAGKEIAGRVAVGCGGYFALTCAASFKTISGLPW